MKQAGRASRPRHMALFPDDGEALIAARPALEQLLVLTAEEDLERWDRPRIARSLVRDAGMSALRAGAMAARIEATLAGTRMKVVPASLVRELANAELIAAGIPVERARPSRIGLSVVDVGDILRGERHARGRDPSTPASTGRELSARVKRDYALAAVFSAPVADAHRRGRLHFGAIDAIDRPERLALALPPWSGAPGAGMGAWRGSAAFRAITELAPVLGDCLELRALDVALAPLLAKRSGTVAEEVLSALDESAALVRGAGGARVVATLEGGEAAAASLLAALSRTPLRTLELELRIGSAFFALPGHLALLELAAEAACRTGLPRIRFVRDSLDQAPAVLSTVHLNLVRLHCERGGDREAMRSRLHGLLGIAARAHIEKRVFLEDLLARGGHGPLAALARRGRAPAPFALECAEQVMAVSGLIELAEATTGRSLERSAAARAWARDYLVQLGHQLGALSRRHKLRFRLAATSDTGVSTRFARLDLHHFPEAAARLLSGDPAEGGARYVDGVALAAADPRPGMGPRAATALPVARRLRYEGELAGMLPLAACSWIDAAELGASGQDASRLLLSLWSRTRVGAVAIRPVPAT